MLTFAVVIASGGGQVPESVLDRLRDPAPDGVPFRAATHLVWSNERKTVWFAGWQDTTGRDEAAQHWHLDDEGLTAFAGDVWPRRDGWLRPGPWAEQLAAHVGAGSLGAQAEDLGGIFVAASLRSRGRCEVAADPLGVGLAYWGRTPTVTVVATRGALAAELLAAESGTVPRRDARGAGWLAFGIQAVGLRTGFEQVSVLPDDTWVEADPDGAVRLRAAPRRRWLLPDAEAAAPEDLLEAAHAEMATSIRMAGAVPGRAQASGLTGGKDSRLVLALLLAEGTAGDFEFQTFGADDLPDITIARQLAEQYGLRHCVRPNLVARRVWLKSVYENVRDAGYPDLSQREIDLRISAWSGGGARNVSETSLGRPPPHDQVLLSGFFGETLRTNFPHTSRWTTKAQVARFPVTQRYATAGVLRPEAALDYRREFHRVLFDGSCDSDSPQDVIDAFYMRHRLRRWFGTEYEINSQSRVFPLYSLTAIRLAFAIGAENRHAEWIHYQLMQRACEPLVHLEFAAGAWNEGAAGGLVPVRTHCEPAPSTPPIPPTDAVPTPPPPTQPWVRTASRDLRAQAQAADVQIMERHLRDDPSNPVFDIIDPLTTQRAIDHFDELGESQRLQLYGALTAAIWLGGQEIALPR